MMISVFGIGYVGVVSSACLASKGHVVIAVDVNQRKVDALNEGRAPIAEPGLADLIKSEVSAGRLSATTDVEKAIDQSEASVVCVGTPSLANGDLNLSQVVCTCESIAGALRNKRAHHDVVLRSTMLPGSMCSVVIPALERCAEKRIGESLGVAYYPEFLREGSAIRDYREASVVVFGVNDRTERVVTGSAIGDYPGVNDRTERVLAALVGQVPGSVFVTDFATAEAIKYASNAWHAAKIVFANEIGNFCKASQVDSYKVMKIVCADKRLNMSSAYMRPGFAFGGSCLPKDLRALLYQARSRDLTLPMLEALSISNNLQIRHAFSLVQAAENRRVGLIGLSFKEATDDLRESPSVELAELLFGKGYQLRIFDHNVQFSKLMGANLSYIQSHIPHLARLLTTDLDDVVKFGDTLVVATTDLGGRRLPPLRKTQVLIDLVRLDGDARPDGGIYNCLC